VKVVSDAFLHVWLNYSCMWIYIVLLVIIMMVVILYHFSLCKNYKILQNGIFAATPHLFSYCEELFFTMKSLFVGCQRFFMGASMSIKNLFI